MATKVVLDASALVAFLRGEAGALAVADHISSASMATINVTEAADALSRRGLDGREAFDAVGALGIEVIDVDYDLARMAGDLYLPTRSAGLSLADRVCLALAKRSEVSAITSDRAWKTLSSQLGVEVELIR